MTSVLFHDRDLICALHTAEMYGSARSMLAHIETVGPEFRGTHVFLSAGGPLVEYLQRAGTSLRVVPFIHRGLRRKRVPTVSYLRDLVSVVNSRRRYVSAVQRFARENPCLVHVHSSVCIYAMWAAKRAGAPLVVHVRETRRPTWESWLREQLVLKLADRIITVSDGIRRGYSAAFQRQAVTIHNWVDVPNLVVNTCGDRRVLGFVGSVHPEKGVREFLEMCAQLKRAGEPFQAHVYGRSLNPETDGWCRAFVQREGLEAVVQWRGVRQGAEEIYPNMDICVLPTHYDALPRSIMEAMAWGVPVVASEIGGIPEMVGEEEAGYLVPRGDVSALTQAVLKLLRDAKLRRKLGEAGRRRAAAMFSRERYREQMLALYRGLLEEYQR